MKDRIPLLLIAFFWFFNLKAQDADQFTPGELWKDQTGTRINAHGGGILFHHGTYYWYGEHKVEGEPGNTAQAGVGCYSFPEHLCAARARDSRMPIFSLVTAGCPKMPFTGATYGFPLLLKTISQ